MVKSNRLIIKYIRFKFFILCKISKKIAAKKAFMLFCTPFNNSTTTPIAFPDNAESLEFDLDGILIRGFRWNKGGKEVVHILHGFSSSISNFYHFIPPLIEKNFEIVAFDAPAHGKSEGTHINAVIYANMIKKITDLYGPVQNYITHSFGGLAVCLALENIPHGELTKVVLISPATETTTAVEGAFKLLNIHDPGVRRAFDDLIFRISGKPTEWYSIKRALKNMSANILWIHDERDDITPIKDARNALSDHPANVSFCITQGLGHRKIYRDPEIIKKVISFF